MAGNSLSLVWDLIARDGASPVFEKVGAAAESAGAKTEAASAKVSGGFSTAAKAGAAAGLVFAAASIKMAADFQSSTTRLVTSANESQKNLGMVQQGLLDMAGKLGYSTEALATAMYKVESGGQHGAAGLEVLKAAAQGAKTENADLTTVADALTSAMTDYHLKASDAATVTSKLVAATASGKMTFQELAGSLSAILPVASANHVALNDILGDLASMTMHGMSAEQASQNLADAIRHLAAPTQQQQKEFAALGLTTQQITADLGTKGLSGTINIIGDAIRAQMGGSTSQVVLDLNMALSKLPAPVKALGQSILEGTISLGDYRKAMKALPAEQAIAAQSFMGLVSSTHQIGNETKNGAQIYQSYSGALRQALGDATGMNVALMIGGENAGNTATAISNVSKATADASGNVRGWSEIEGTFNQQASETLHSLEAMTIEAGMHLLPAMTSAMGYINRDAIPAIKGLASGAVDAIHWWSQLPAPIKDVSGALAAVAVASKLGLLSGLGSGAGTVAAAFKSLGASAAASGVQLGGFSSEMAVQQRLFQMETAGLAGVDAAFASAGVAAGTYAASLTNVQRMQMGWDASLAESAVMEDAQVASLGRMSAAMATVQARGMGALTAGMNGLKSAGSGLMGMFGGPWGLALAGAAVDILLITNAEQKATEQEQKWTEALKQGGEAATRASAAMAKNAAEVEAIHSGFQGFGTSIASAIAPVDAMIPHAQKAAQSYRDWYAALGYVEQKQQDVTTATTNLSDVMKHHAAGSLAVNEAEQQVRVAEDALTVATNTLSSAHSTAAQKAQEQANAELGLASQSLGAKQAQDEFTQTLDSYRTTTEHSAVETDALAQSALSAASAAMQAGTAWAAANHVSDTATAGNYAQLLSLEKVAQAMGTDTPVAVTQQIEALKRAVAQGNLTQQQMDAITRSIYNIPKDTPISVTADVQAAKNAIDGLLKNYQHVQYTGSSIVVNGRVIANAEGNLLPMSATAASIVSPGALRVIGDNPVADEAFIPINSSSRSMSILGETASRMGMGLVPMAAGGFWNIGEQFPAQPSQAMLDSARQAIASFAPPAGPAGGAARWTNLVLQALAMMNQPASLLGITLARMNQESGGNPNAINLWDSNARAGHPSQGLMQTIPSTFLAYHYPGTSYNIDDPLANVLASMRYALARYGSLSAAYGRVGGYKDGTNFVPTDQLAMLHRGEAVVPAAQNQGAPYQAGGQTIVGSQYLAPVTITDTDARDARSYRHASMAAARFR